MLINRILKYWQYKKFLFVKRNFEKILDTFNLETNELNELSKTLKLQKDSLKVAEEKNNSALIKEYQNLVDITTKTYNKKKEIISQLCNIIENNKKSINILKERIENIHFKSNLSKIEVNIANLQNRISNYNNINFSFNCDDEEIEYLQNRLKEEYKKLEAQKSVKKDLAKLAIN